MNTFVPGLAPPIRRPDYTATVGLTCEQWIAENHEDLWWWFEECEGEPRDVVGFKDFAATQYELEVDRDDLMRALLAEGTRDDDAYEDYKGREIDAELGEGA